MADVVVYGFPQSGFVRTACMALEEKGVDYVREDIDMGSESHRALHPFAKMPILKHEDFVLYETSAITRYIDQVFDGPALQPSDARACARMSQWISAHNHYYIATIARELFCRGCCIRRRGLRRTRTRLRRRCRISNTSYPSPIRHCRKAPISRGTRCRWPICSSSDFCLSGNDAGGGPAARPLSGGRTLARGHEGAAQLCRHGRAATVLNPFEAEEYHHGATSRTAIPG